MPRFFRRRDRIAELEGLVNARFIGFAHGLSGRPRLNVGENFSSLRMGSWYLAGYRLGLVAANRDWFEPGGVRITASGELLCAPGLPGEYEKGGSDA